MTDTPIPTADHRERAAEAFFGPKAMACLQENPSQALDAMQEWTASGDTTALRRLHSPTTVDALTRTAQAIANEGARAAEAKRPHAVELKLLLRRADSIIGLCASPSEHFDSLVAMWREDVEVELRKLEMTNAR